MLYETAISRWFSHGPKRILFSPWPMLEPSIRRSFRYSSHQIEFGEIPQGGGDFDLVVPLTVKALLGVSQDNILRSKNPLPLPTKESINLCDDKQALNHALRSAGFERNIPEDTVPGQYPYILRRKHDEGGKNAYFVDNPTTEALHSSMLESEDYILQKWIPGELEYTTHYLHFGAKAQREVSIKYQMRNAHTIRGREFHLSAQRHPPEHTELFEQMLNAIGFSGLCCVNYKIENGIPYLLEINPRFGVSLAPYFFPFVRSLNWREKSE